MRYVTLLLPLIVLAGCAREEPMPCPLCYSDAWSREPFTGQPKQHIKPLTPEELEANKGVIPRPVNKVQE